MDPDNLDFSHDLDAEDPLETENELHDLELRDEVQEVLDAAHAAQPTGPTVIEVEDGDPGGSNTRKRKIRHRVGESMEKSVMECLKRLYEAYANEGGHRVEEPRAMPRDTMNDDFEDPRMSLASQFDSFLEEELSSVCESEVDKYLVSPCERRPREKEGEGNTFDILDWWKHNSVKYPVLSRVAQDVLAMPVSTVASESAFSTGGRILDPFRSSLSPLMVERLVCTQNWLLSTVPISLRQAMDKVEEFEQSDPDLLEIEATS